MALDDPTPLDGLDEAWMAELTADPLTGSAVWGAPFDLPEPESFEKSDAGDVLRLKNKGRTIRARTRQGDSGGTVNYSLYSPQAAALLTGATFDPVTGETIKSDTDRPRFFGLVLRTTGVDDGDRVWVYYKAVQDGDLTIGGPEDGFAEPSFDFVALPLNSTRRIMREIPRTGADAVPLTAQAVTNLLNGAVAP